MVYTYIIKHPTNKVTGQQIFSMSCSYRLHNNNILLYTIHRILGEDYTLCWPKFQIPIN